MRKVLITLGILGALMVSAVYLTQGQAPPPASAVATYNATGLGANLAATLISPQVNPVIYALGGTYKANCYVILTTVDGSSSTLPKCQVVFTDADTTNSHTQDVTATSTANTADTIGPAPAVTAQLPGGGAFHVAPSTAISIDTTGYASNTSGQMKYAIHFTLQYVGP